jgi:probable DNA metabolism protein
MTTLVYDGSFKGWLTAVFEVYEYKFNDAGIRREDLYQDELMHKKHLVISDEKKAARVWQKLLNKLSRSALRQMYQSFLGEEKNIENILLTYVRYALLSQVSVEHDFGHPAVLHIQQTARKVHREKHRMEAFVRFELTKDKLFYAIIQPDFNVLPLIQTHFRDRYADQRWLIYDTRRKYGIYYDLQEVTEVKIDFSDHVTSKPDLVYDEKETMYQQLWQQYFASVNIKARKNTRLHIQHMPKRYWKHLTEKRI